MIRAGRSSDRRRTSAQGDTGTRRSLRRGISDILVTFGARGAALVLGLALQGALARLLEPAGRGSYAVCVMCGNVLAVLFLFGLDSAVQFHVSARLITAGKGARVILAAGLIGGAAAAVVGVIGSKTEASLFSRAPRAAFLIAFAWIPFQMWATSLLMIVTALREFGMAAGLTTAQIFVRLVVTLLLCGAGAMGVEGALWANVIASASISAAALIWLRRRFPVDWSPPGAGQRRVLLGYGVRSHLGAICNLANVQIGTLILAMFVDEEAIGLFAAPVAVILTIVLVSDAVASVLQPRVAEVKGGRPELTALCARMAALLTTVVVGLMAAFAEPILSVVLSEKFAASAPIMRVVAIGAVARAASKVIIPYHNGTNRPGVVAWATVAGTAVNAGLLPVLLPSFELLGAAWAMTIGYVVSAVILVGAFHAHSGLSVAAVWRPRASDASAAAAILTLRGAMVDAGRPDAPGE